MFDFERLKVYQCIKLLNIDLLRFLNSCKSLDPYLKDQIKRSTLSIAFNLAEGVGRASSKDKRHYYVMARASCYESVAALQVVKEFTSMSDQEYHNYYSRYTEVSKMLYALTKTIKTL